MTILIVPSLGPVRVSRSRSYCDRGLSAGNATWVGAAVGEDRHVWFGDAFGVCDDLDGDDNNRLD
jgi:hypothetical protein